MEQRQDDEERVLLRDLGAKALQRADHIVQEVRMRQHRALRLARRARRVDDRGHVARLGEISIVPLAAVADHQGLQTHHVRLTNLLSVKNDAVNDDDAAQLRQPRRNVHEHPQMRLVRRHDRHLGVVEDVPNLLVMELRIHRDDRDARARLGKIGNHPLRMVRQDDRRVLFPRFQAEARRIPLGDLPNLLIKLIPSLGLPGFVLAPPHRHVIGDAHRATLKQSTNCHVENP